MYIGRPNTGLESEINCNIDGALENVLKRTIILNDIDFSHKGAVKFCAVVSVRHSEMLH